MIAQFRNNEKRPCSEAKAEARRLMLARRSALSPEEGRRMGKLAAKNMIESDPWKKAKIVALYASLPGEIPSSDLMKAAWTLGKIILLPKIIDRRERRMRFAVCSGEGDTRPGSFGIMEPVGDEEMHPDFIVLPGLAFDEKGNRLGYGGGYYDRYLGALDEKPPLAGFCFDFQIAPSVPNDSADVPVNFLCSPSGFRCL